MRCKDAEEEKIVGEQIENAKPAVQVIPATPGSSKISTKTSSSSTIKASKVNPSTMGEGEMNIVKRIEEWMRGREGKKGGEKDKSDCEPLLQAKF
jgi:hypothetical protein